MRLVKQIPHDRFLIQLHVYNGKYLLKISLDNFDQTFKVDEGEFPQIDQLETLIEGTFLTKCIIRFVEMREDWKELLTSKV